MAHDTPLERLTMNLERLAGAGRSTNATAREILDECRRCIEELADRLCDDLVSAGLERRHARLVVYKVKRGRLRIAELDVQLIPDRRPAVERSEAELVDAVTLYVRALRQHFDPS